MVRWGWTEERREKEKWGSCPLWTCGFILLEHGYNFINEMYLKVSMVDTEKRDEGK